MAKKNNQLCKCPISCNRHGDCTACRDYHTKDKSKIFCEKSNYEKMITRDCQKIKKATSVPFPKIPDITPNTIKAINQYQNAVKNIASPSDFSGFSKKIKAISTATEQFTKTFLPNIQNIVNIGSTIFNVFEKQMKNEYNFKQDIILKWNNLETEIKNKNRYFIKSDLLTILENCVVIAEYVIPKGYYFYRARKFNLNEFSKDVIGIIQKVSGNFNDYHYQILSDKEKDIWDYINNISYDEWENDYLNEQKLKKIKFWGYNAKQSEAPPSSKTIPGRANPVGISYLYTSDTIDTAISEIQPTIGQLISVAKIKTIKELKNFNFNFYEALENSEYKDMPLVDIEEQIGFSLEMIKVFFDTISELYSKPSFGYSDNYYVSQYISEFIKNKGFDGIKYNSSLKKNGKNYVLFDTSKDDKGRPNNYRVLGSSLHKIDNVFISEKVIFPKYSELNSELNGEHNE